MDPERLEEIINAGIDGQADPADRAVLADSLAKDAESRSLAADIREQDELLRQAFASRRRGAETLARAGVGSPAPAATAPRGSRWRHWLPMLLAAAAGFLLAVVLFRPWDKSGDMALGGSGIT